MNVKDILQVKGPEVITVGAEKTVFDAISILTKHRIGALLVLNQEGEIVGIISERDILNESHNNYESLKQSKVKEIMTKDIIIGKPIDDLKYVETVMTENRIRHLPIIDNERLVGIISIGDIIKSLSDNMEIENHYLRDYVVGKY